MPQEPDRVRRAASKATGISAATGPDAEPLNLATDSAPQVIERLLSFLGMADPLGVGAGSQQAAALPPVAPSELRYAELLKKLGGRNKIPSTGWKPLHELVGEVFAPAEKSSQLPKRVRLASYNVENNNVITHAIEPPYTRMDATIDDFTKLVRDGALVPDGPPTEGKTVPQLWKLLEKALSRGTSVARRVKK